MGSKMFFKKGKDYIYVVKECTLDPDKEVLLYRDKDVEIDILTFSDKKAPLYYRIKSLNNKAKIQMMSHTLVMAIPKRKYANKMIGNYVQQNLALCEYTFNNVGYIVFGKSCTEENI